MKQPTFCGRELLSLSVIEAARAGDPLAVERVLRYYEGYINKLCKKRHSTSNPNIPSTKMGSRRSAAME